MPVPEGQITTSKIWTAEDVPLPEEPTEVEEKEEEREEKAYQAMLICQEEHTWLARMKQFIRIVEERYER